MSISLTGNKQKDMEKLKKMMQEHAKNLEFEKAAKIRDMLFELSSSE